MSSRARARAGPPAVLCATLLLAAASQGAQDDTCAAGHACGTTRALAAEDQAEDDVSAIQSGSLLTVASTRSGTMRSPAMPARARDQPPAAPGMAREGPGVTSTEEPEDVVDVLAGTSMDPSKSNGLTLPQVKLPWGFNDWVPQTNPDPAQFFRRGDTSFLGIRCTHEPSVWIGDYSHITIMPHLGVRQRRRPLKYSSVNATFRPYLFRAELSQRRRGPILLELAPTSHAAVLQVTFPRAGGTPEKTPCISVQGGQITTNNGTITGYTTSTSGGTPKNWKMYFVLRAAGAQAATADGDPGTLKFPDAAGEPVRVAIATSFVSVEQAVVNLEREVGSSSFSSVVNEARMEWRSVLGRARVEATSESQLRVFYTNLWKASLFPRFIQETSADGQEVHFSPYKGEVLPGKLVADSGFWDAYHTVYPLQSVLFPDKFGQIIDGWVNAYEEAGWLPTWASPGQRNSMVSTMGDVSLADAIVKSKLGLVSGFNATKAYEAIRKDAFVPGTQQFGRTSLMEYIDYGYVPSDGRTTDNDVVAESLNYYVADAAIARAAEALGKGEDARTLRSRSAGFKRLFNGDSLFFQPRKADGTFAPYFDPLRWGDGFTEGNAWHYRFNVPHDVDGLKSLYRGNLCDYIGQMVGARQGRAYEYGSYGELIHEMVEAKATQGLFGFYAHNNQPSHDILWLAKRAGCDELADMYLRQVMEQLYTVDGWSGDEDNGEMASWFVLSALGLYSLEGAKDELVLGSPAVARADVDLPGGRRLRVSVQNQSLDHPFVHSVSWAPSSGSGGPLPQRRVLGSTIRYSELMGGGELRFVLGAEPPERQPGGQPAMHL